MNEPPEHLKGGLIPSPTREDWWLLDLGCDGPYLEVPPSYWDPVRAGDVTVVFPQGFRINFHDDWETARNYADENQPRCHGPIVVERARD